jgi:hypothetical protein
LKLFVPRTGHLVQAKDVPLLEHQTIWKSQKKRMTKEDVEMKGKPALSSAA